MSDISLLMASVLTGNPSSLPDQLPLLSPVQPDIVGQNSTQESSSTSSNADIISPEFLQVNSSIATTSSVINQKYQKRLSTLDSLNKTICTAKEQHCLSPYTPFQTKIEELEVRTEFSTYPSKTCGEHSNMTYDEFAASLAVCLQQIDELLTDNINSIEPEDFILLRRLRQEVKAELACVGIQTRGFEHRD